MMEKQASRLDLFMSLAILMRSYVIVVGLRLAMVLRVMTMKRLCSKRLAVTLTALRSMGTMEPRVATMI